MKSALKIKNFDFEYTGSNLTEKDAIENGFLQLAGEVLLSRINNKKIFGVYIMGYKFGSIIYENGTTEGVNNVGTQDFGHWIIDMELNTMSIKWKNAWFDTITHAYEVNDTIEFYDVDTGKWRTTFKMFENLKEE